VAARGVTIRPAEPADLPLLVEIERRAGEAFAAQGMPEIAADDPGSPEELEEYRAAGRAWVAAEDGAPVAYLVAAEVDGCIHIEQVSVDPARAGRGIGAALIEHVAGLAREAGRPALTLTTFRDIPWNALLRAAGVRRPARAGAGTGNADARRPRADGDPGRPPARGDDQTARMNAAAGSASDAPITAPSRGPPGTRNEWSPPVTST
jgi:GNAT superfamily N-acetyltransferase